MQSASASHALVVGSTQPKVSGPGSPGVVLTQKSITGHSIVPHAKVGTQHASGPASTLPQPSCR